MDDAILNNEQDYERSLPLLEKQNLSHYLTTFLASYMYETNRNHAAAGFNLFLKYYNWKAKKEELTQLLIPWFCLNSAYYVFYVDIPDAAFSLPGYFIAPKKVIKTNPSSAVFKDEVARSIRNTYLITYKDAESAPSMQSLKQNIFIVDKEINYVKI